MYNPDFDARAKTWDDNPARRDLAQAAAQAIITKAKPEAYTKALDYGCGTGLLGLLLREHCASITLADSSPGMLEVLKEKIAAAGFGNLNPILLDLSAGQRPAEHYDLICAHMCLHHIKDTAKMLAEFCSLLNQDGKLCITDLEEEDGSFHGPGFEGHNGFKPETLLHLATEAGFTMATCETIHRVKRENGKEYPIFILMARK